MAPQLDAGTVAKLCGGTVLGDPRVKGSGVFADSRTILPGQIFAAVGQGDEHVSSAIRAGASFAITSQATDGITAVVVEDMQTALGKLATCVGKDLSAQVIGITGSTGKTLTKDLTKAACSALRVHATPASYNAEIGLPLSILSCPADAEVLILEMAARARGQIAELCQIARPSIGIITGIGWAHLGEFGSRDAIAQTKAELLNSLPGDGHAFVPSGDDYLPTLSTATSAKITTVGPGGHVTTGEMSLDTTGRPGGRCTVRGTPITFRMPVAGRALVRSGAFALGVAGALGIDLDEASRRMAKATLTSGRMQIRPLDSRTIIDDTWNASPVSVASTLKTAMEVARGRPVWLILGPMGELGSISRSEHVRTGRLAADLGVRRLIAFGEPGEWLIHGFGRGETELLEDSNPSTIVSAIGASPTDGVVVVKASRVWRLERATALLFSAKVRS